MRTLACVAFSLATLAACGVQAKNASTGRGVPGEPVKEPPLKRGIWEETVVDGSRVVYGPARFERCAESLWFLLPSLFPGEYYGRTLPEKVISGDSVRRLPDGTYRVAGGAKTTRAGDLTYTHILTLHGDTEYDDNLTVTSHAATHPTDHMYKGSGHWVAPCTAAPR